MVNRIWTLDEQMEISQLQRTGLRVGVVLHEPWAYACGLRPSSKPLLCTYPGMGIEFTRRLCHRLQIICHFINLNASALGARPEGVLDQQSRELGTDIQSGIIAKIATSADEANTIDTFLPNLVETKYFRQLVSFTLPMFYMEGGLLIRTRFDNSDDILFVARPFTYSVWFLLFCTLFLAVVLDLVCRFVLESQTSDGKINTRGVVLYNFALLIQRGVNQNVRFWARKILYGTLGVSSIVLCGMYSASLVSQTVATKIVLPFDDVEGLVKGMKTQNYKLLIDQHSAYFLTQVKSSPLPIFQDLYNLIKLRPPEMVNNVSQTVERISKSNGNLVLYSSIYSLLAVANVNCNLTIIPLKGFMDRGAFAFRKHPPIAELFNKLSLLFNKDLGNFMELAEKKYRFGRNCDKARSAKDVQFKMKYLEGMFLLGGLGLFASVVAFLSEIVRSKMKFRAQMQTEIVLTRAPRIHLQFPKKFMS